MVESSDEEWWGPGGSLSAEGSSDDELEESLDEDEEIDGQSPFSQITGLGTGYGYGTCILTG